MNRSLSLLLCGVVGLLALTSPLAAQSDDDGRDVFGLRAKDLSWRTLGPATMSGRFVDVAVLPGDPSSIYAASASGGLWKTVNRGTTWKPVFDSSGRFTLGAVAVAPSNPEVVWVGTGEANNQRSSYSGDGVWKSVDGGEKWTCMGLPESHHIGRIAIDPRDPDVVWVAALGHLYTPNSERGLYRTRDGGKSWDLVLDLGEDTGVVDVVVDPASPDTVYCASYERRRRAWNFSEGGAGSAIWRSTDGGEKWKKLGGGLPGGKLGRIGLALHPEQTKTLYVHVENLEPAAIPEVSTDAPSTREAGEGVDGEAEPEEESEAPAAIAAPKVRGEVYRSDDGGETWTRTCDKSVGGSPFYYYGQIRVDPSNVDKLWVVGVRLSYSEDGGKTWKTNGAPGVHVDHHALWIDPADSDHLLLGNDGGLCRSYDGGKTWDVYDNLPVAQFYTVAVDRRTPYWIYGGLQDNGSYAVPSRGRGRRGVTPDQTLRINGGDGFVCVPDPEEPETVYCESQFGVLVRLDLAARTRKRIRPRREKGSQALRWNWMTPIALSPHNHRILYTGAQKVFRSLDRGDSWEALSPDLTTADPDKIAGNVPHCTLTTLAESPARAGVIWVGSDDGRVHVSQNGGRHWRDLTEYFPAEVQGLWVSRVEPSHHDPARAWVSFTGYREDHFEPWLFVTEDYGGTWTRLRRGLPTSPINVVREDAENEDLLFVGTEEGVYYSLDRGDRWERLDRDLPPAPVHDLVVQPDVGDLVAATHGRGFFVLDVAPLRALTKAAREEAMSLLSTKIVAPSAGGFGAGYAGLREFTARNPRSGCYVALRLRRKPKDEVTLEVQDLLGNTLRPLRAPDEAGIHVVRWNFRLSRNPDGSPAAPRARGRRGVPQGRRAPPGQYKIVLNVGKETRTRLVTVPAPVGEPVYKTGVEY